MFGTMGTMFGLIWGLLMAVLFAVGLVWLYFSIRFFKIAGEYYQHCLDTRTQEEQRWHDLLAGIDQLVDVLKVK